MRATISKDWMEFSPPYTEWRTAFLKSRNFVTSTPLTYRMLEAESNESLLQLYRDLAPAITAERLIADSPDRKYLVGHAARWAKETIEMIFKSRNVDITAHD
jgi:hypothetical protein